MSSGWEGSTADAIMFSQFCFTYLAIPDGKYYLANAGFGACDALLVPYYSICYHLAKWACADAPCVYMQLFMIYIEMFFLDQSTRRSFSISVMPLLKML